MGWDLRIALLLAVALGVVDCLLIGMAIFRPYPDAVALLLAIGGLAAAIYAWFAIRAEARRRAASRSRRAR